MSVASHAGSKKRKKSDSKPYSQINKCLNEKRRREQENIHIEELAELVSASPSDMSSLSCKPDKCAILKETVNQIRTQKELSDQELCDDLQQSEVSSSKPNIINNHVFGAILLEAIDGFIFVVNNDGKVEFVSENIVAFLNFKAEEVNEKLVYDFIHPEDRARFHSNLLLMMPLGNGRDWSSENSFISNKPTKHFNCRFLVKQDNSDIKMENKSSNSQYENLSISANFMPLEDGNNEPRNGLTCIARRVPFEEKRIGMNNVEQFTTKIDCDGKVIDIDTSNLSQSCSLYLCKELKNSSILDLCHPADISTFKQHLKETFETGQATCVPYKLRIEQDRYVRIQTKSKIFSSEEYAVSTHSIIRDNTVHQDTLRSISSPSTASTSSGPESISDSSTSINGSAVLSPMSISNSYGSYATSLSTVNSSEYGLSDLVLDIFPSANWTMDPGSAQSKESDCTSVTNFVQSPQTPLSSSAAPLSNRSDISAVASPTNSAFLSGLTSSRGGSSVPSPAMQNRAPTPYGGSCYSPSAASQSSSGRSPPPRALSAKSDSLNFNSAESSINSISPGIRQDRQLSNQKLRNLLTQNTDDSALRQNLRHVTQEEVASLLNSRVLENNSGRANLNQNVPQSDNVILRDLLSQEDENCEDVPVEPIRKCMESPVPNPLMNAGACKAAEKSAQQRQLGNNMLRKLLNSDDADKSYRKTDIIQQLLVSSPGNSKVSLQNEKIRTENVPVARSAESSVPKQISAEASRGSPEVTYITETTLKRKVSDRNLPSTSAKKPNNTGTHLAGQNPMLASMLAQTPRTPPSVPTSVANTIMTQLPQERLPKNLEKKLVHTPVTAVPISGIPTSSLTYSTIALTSPSVQRDIVTSGGHVLQQSAQFTVQAGLRQAAYLQQQQQQHQGILDKILSSGINEENILIPRSLAISLSNMANPAQQNATSFAQLTHTASEANNSTSYAEMLNDSNLGDANSLSDSAQSNQAADLGFDALLDQIYSLREEHNVEIPRGSDDPQAILKLLGDSLDVHQANTAAHLTSVPSAQEMHEKIAISAIQKELEGTAAAIANRANQNTAVISTYSQSGRSLPQVSPVVQAQITPEQLILFQQQQMQQQIASNSLPPNYSLVANRVRLPISTQANIVNQNALVQAQRRGVQVVRNINIGSADLALLRLQKNANQSAKQRALLQQQKRLLDQQKQQQLAMQTQQPMDGVTSPGSTTFTTENINDLMNNTVAPNVTLLRSSGIPEVPGSARFNLISASSLPSPTSQASPTSAQLSPGQRVNQPSPFSQQSFSSQTPPPTSSYQAARLSPHPPPPSYPQGATSHSPSPISSTASSLMVLSPQSTNAGSPQWSQRAATSPLQNLQLQNPMLNAQLSQASLGAKGIHLTAQQKQLLRTLQASANAQNTRNIIFTQPQQQQQSDLNFNPVSPVMVLQSQATQQQRMQRNRIPSGTQPQQNFTTSESVLSPQSLPSPSFNQSLATTPTSAFLSISSPGVPVTYSLASAGQHFTFERQNIQVFTTSPSDSLRSSANEQSTSDNLQAQLRIINTSQNQQLSANLNQQLLQSLTSGGSLTTARVVNVNSLTREALEELGLSVELLAGEAQPASQLLFSQALLNESNNLENSTQPVSPQVQVEEPKPDQKKSLLQQLLSEPT